MKQPHTHVDERGFVVKCYHKSKTEISRWGFWVGLTIGFPIEHFLWGKVWPFMLVKDWMGL